MEAVKEAVERMSLIELRRDMLNADIQRRWDMRVLGLTDEQITAYDTSRHARRVLRLSNES